MKLIDVFPDALTGSGIFDALNNYNVPWKTDVSSISLDLEYFGNVSGDKTVSPLIRKLSVNGVLSPTAVSKIAQSLYTMHGLRWTKLWNTYQLEYDPIQNYNMTEIMSDDDTITTYGRTHSKTGTEVDDRTRTDDNKESVYGFNSSNASDSDESDRTINDDNTHTYNVSDTDTGSDRQSHSYELTRSGNIGVTTSQQMIESERALWMWRYFYDVVFPDVDKMLTISVYSDDVIPVNISGGVTPTGTIYITSNGDYDVTAYADASVDVPNTYTELDEGMVVHDGELVSQIGREISVNGTYDTTLNNAVMVDVPNTYTAADDGKVVSDGALISQTSKNITDNGTYDTTYNDEVIVNVNTIKQPLSHSDQNDILVSELAEDYTSGSSVWGNLTVNGGSGVSVVGGAVRMPSTAYATFDLGSVNHSATLYAVCRQYSVVQGDLSIIAAPYAESSGNVPGFYSRNGMLMRSVYGGSDTSVDVPANAWNVITISIDAVNKVARYYVNGVVKSNLSFNNSGQYAYINATLNGGRSINNDYWFIGVVDGVESESVILANQKDLLIRYYSEL